MRVELDYRVIRGGSWFNTDAVCLRDVTQQRRTAEPR